MKITKSRLKQLIKEEVQKILEATVYYPDDPVNPGGGAKRQSAEAAPLVKALQFFGLQGDETDQGVIDRAIDKAIAAARGDNLQQRRIFDAERTIEELLPGYNSTNTDPLAESRKRRFRRRR